MLFYMVSDSPLQLPLRNYHLTSFDEVSKNNILLSKNATKHPFLFQLQIYGKLNLFHVFQEEVHIAKD